MESIVPTQAIISDAARSAVDINLDLPIDEATLASLLQVSVHWLRKDRSGKRVIPFVKMRSHLIRYIPSRVFDALDKHCTVGGPIRK